MNDIKKLKLAISERISFLENHKIKECKDKTYNILLYTKITTLEDVLLLIDVLYKDKI